MKLCRNGMLIELTSAELREAHEEYEHICDIDDVNLVLEEDFEEIALLSIAENVIEKMAKRKRKYQDDGMLWREAAKLAIRDVLDEEKM